MKRVAAALAVGLSESAAALLPPPCHLAARWKKRAAMQVVALRATLALALRLPAAVKRAAKTVRITISDLGWWHD